VPVKAKTIATVVPPPVATVPPVGAQGPQLALRTAAVAATAAPTATTTVKPPPPVSTGIKIKPRH
jgi:hypothetical protein